MAECMCDILDDDYLDEIVCMRGHCEEIDLSEFTSEEIDVIARFIYKFPDYAAIRGIYIKK